MLALDPTRGGFGFVVLEGTQLIDWGLVVHGGRLTIHRRVKRLFARYAPDALASEDISGDKLRIQAWHRLAAAHQFATDRGVDVLSILGHEIAAQPEWATHRKYDRARAIVALYPQLASKLPPPRKRWSSEVANFAIFDAVALGLTAIRLVRKGSELQRDSSTSICAYGP